MIDYRNQKAILSGTRLTGNGRVRWRNPRNISGVGGGSTFEILTPYMILVLVVIFNKCRFV